MFSDFEKLKYHYKNIVKKMKMSDFTKNYNLFLNINKIKLITI